MSEFDKTNRFTLWQNKDKTADKPTWADFQGEINIDGVDYYLSAWKRKPDGNPKAPPLSGTVKLKEARQAPADYEKPEPAAQVGGDPYYDSIPFNQVDYRAS